MQHPPHICALLLIVRNIAQNDKVLRHTCKHNMLAIIPFCICSTPSHDKLICALLLIISNVVQNESLNIVFLHHPYHNVQICALLIIISHVLKNDNLGIRYGSFWSWCQGCGSVGTRIGIMVYCLEFV